MVPGIKRTAYRVDRADWRLFSGPPAATLVLNGDGLPAEEFMCLISVEGDDVDGSISIGSETIDFDEATTRTTTTLLSALPVITTTGLAGCTILIEAINRGGAPILKETLTTIKIGFKQTQKSFRDAAGKWTVSSAIAKTTDTDCNLDTLIRVGGVDYTVGQVEPKCKPSGREYMRKLWLQ